MPGTPFWAPDSRRLGLVDRGALKIFDGSGGPPITIASISSTNTPGAGSWNQDDVILFSEVRSPVYRVPAHGGSVTAVTQLDRARNETGHLSPWFLPDGHHFLYVAVSTDSAESAVYAGDLASKTRKVVLTPGARALYVNPGYLLFVRGQTLMAQPFNPGKLETAGDAVPIAEQVNSYNAGGAVHGHFSASQNGVLTYISGNAAGSIQLTWFDRKGDALGTIGARGLLEWPALSPDESRAAYTRLSPSTNLVDVWVWDVAHGSEARLTSAGENRFPVWSSDGRSIFFMGGRGGGIYRKRANGTGGEELMDPSGKAPQAASSDGRYLFTSTGADIWVLPLSGDRKSFPYVSSEFREGRPTLSPDGRWLAYNSNETGRVEVYVSSFPQQGQKWRISTGGGAAPVWSRDGHELYYYSGDHKIMAVDIKSGPPFQYDVPKPLFEVEMPAVNTRFDVGKDGRFLVPVQAEPGGVAPMNVVLNWTEMLQRK